MIDMILAPFVLHYCYCYLGTMCIKRNLPLQDIAIRAISLQIRKQPEGFP